MGNHSLTHAQGKPAIPDDILGPILSDMPRELEKCCDNFITYDWERIRQRCGVEFAGVPLDDLRRQGINLRKRGILRSVKGHGPSVAPKLSDEYKAVLASSEFRAYFDELCRIFGGRCAICNNGGHIEPHHRTYERLGREAEFDCIPVCRKCHKVCDPRRRRQAVRPQEPPLFFGDGLDR